MHERLGMGGKALSIFQGNNMKDMQPSTHLLPGALAGLKEAGSSDSFYWIPSVANFPGVDGILGDTDGHVYAIQAMIADDTKVLSREFKRCGGNSAQRFELDVLGTMSLSQTPKGGWCICEGVFK
jgi:hypothetical protein